MLKRSHDLPDRTLVQSSSEFIVPRVSCVMLLSAAEILKCYNFFCLLSKTNLFYELSRTFRRRLLSRVEV